MFQNISKSIKSLDQFGVYFQLSITQSDKLFQSLCGGLTSLFIYAFTMGYFLFLIYMWKTNQYLPSVVSLSQQINSSYLNLTQNVFTLGVHVDRFDDQIHEMVNRTNLYYVEGVFYGWNYSIVPLQLNKKGYKCGMKVIKQDLYDPICQCNEDYNQTFLYQDSTRQSDSFWEYQVYYCDEQKDKNCTNKTEQQIIIDHQAFWRLTTYSQNYDFQTGDIAIIPQEYYQPIYSMRDQPLYFQVKVTQGVIYVDEGFFFQNWKTIDIISDVTTSISYLPQQKLLGPQVLVSMEKYQIKYIVRHIKIGSLLADLCSVISTLLISRFVLGIFNRNKLMSQAQDILINQYFPNFKDYEIKKDYRGRIIYVQHNQLIYSKKQIQEFIQTYETIKKLVIRKFSYAQIIHDINKLQIAIQYLIPKSSLRNILQIDYIYNPSNTKITDMMKSQIDTSDFIFMNEDRIQKPPEETTNILQEDARETGQGIDRHHQIQQNSYDTFYI